VRDMCCGVDVCVRADVWFVTSSRRFVLDVRIGFDSWLTVCVVCGV